MAGRLPLSPVPAVMMPAAPKDEGPPARRVLSDCLSLYPPIRESHEQKVTAVVHVRKVLLKAVILQSMHSES